MPTSIDYHEAAARFRALGRRLGEAAEHPHSIEHAATGPFADHHRRRVDELCRLLVDAGRELSDLAALCDHRAAVCAAHAHAVARFVQLGLAERLATPAPVPPATWVEV